VSELQINSFLNSFSEFNNVFNFFLVLAIDFLNNLEWSMRFTENTEVSVLMSVVGGGAD